MIDEKKLIEDLKNTFSDSVLNQTFGFGKYTLLEAVEEMINRQPQVETDTNVGSKWLPVEEALPELDEGTECFKQSKEYLVTVQWWDEETNVDIGWYNQNGMWSNDSKNCKVIAWQPRPLPQPYKKEGAE